jgi:hypothetical protein
MVATTLDWIPMTSCFHRVFFVRYVKTDVVVQVPIPGHGMQFADLTATFATLAMDGDDDDDDVI